MNDNVHLVYERINISNDNTKRKIRYEAKGVALLCNLMALHVCYARSSLVYTHESQLERK